jgi:hypothetical protein
MADLGGTFDANAKENQKPFNGLPTGEYPVVMVKSEKKATKDGTGHYLECEFKVVSGECQNKSLFHKFNLWLRPSAVDKEKAEKTEKAVQIARGQFSELCRAVGVETPRDSSELHNKVSIVRVNVKDSGEFGLQNNVQSFKPKQLTPAVASTPAPTTQEAGAAW